MTAIAIATVTLTALAVTVVLVRVLLSRRIDWLFDRDAAGEEAPGAIDAGVTMHWRPRIRPPIFEATWRDIPVTLGPAPLCTHPGGHTRATPCPTCGRFSAHSWTLPADILPGVRGGVCRDHGAWEVAAS